MEAITHISIDVANPSVAPVVRAVQEDIRSRYVAVELLENRQPLTLPAGVTGTVGIRTSRGVHILYDENEDETAAVTFDGNVATVYLRQEALANSDKLYVNLILRSGTAILTAFAFWVEVEALAVPSGAVVQTDYFNILQQEIEEANHAAETARSIVGECTDEADRAESEADRAETYASGVQNPVSYAQQTLSDSQKTQARVNIAAASTSHKSTHAVGGTDALSPADIGAAEASALADYILLTEKGAASGVATLGSDGKVTSVQAAAAYQNVSANKTISASDAGQVLLCTGTITITLASLSQGTELEIWNKGAGLVTLAGTLFVAGYGSLSSCKIQSNSVVVCKRMNSVWHIAGGATS